MSHAQRSPRSVALAQRTTASFGGFSLGFICSYPSGAVQQRCLLWQQPLGAYVDIFLISVAGVAYLGSVANKPSVAQVQGNLWEPKHSYRSCSSSKACFFRSSCVATFRQHKCVAKPCFAQAKLAQLADHAQHVAVGYVPCVACMAQLCYAELAQLALSELSSAQPGISFADGAAAAQQLYQSWHSFAMQMASQPSQPSSVASTASLWCCIYRTCSFATAGAQHLVVLYKQQPCCAYSTAAPCAQHMLCIQHSCSCTNSCASDSYAILWLCCWLWYQPSWLLQHSYSMVPQLMVVANHAVHTAQLCYGLQPQMAYSCDSCITSCNYHSYSIAV